MYIMKRYAFKTVVVVILISAVTIAGITAIRLSQRDTQFQATRIGLKMMLQIQASALNDGYFSWTELQNLVRESDLAGAQAQLREILDLYPFIEDIQIQPGDPPPSPYEVSGSNASIRLRFGLKDDYGNSPLPGWEAVATINAQSLLDALQSKSQLIVDPVKGHELAYSIMAAYKDPLLSWLDYLLIFSVTISVGFAISAWIWRKNLYFYETKGLESIIFLFEQTERISANHSRRVAALTMFLGERMGYKGRKLRNLYTGALLHDIGKISIPSSILLKDSPLTKQEQQAIAAHPIVSARILKNFKELAHLSAIVLYHHERMDGSGYPEGLQGEEIPKESRIIAVVDVFEALIGDRPYRRPVEPDEAFSILKKMPLDQSIVELLIRSYGEFKKFQAPKWVIAYHPSLEKI